MRGRLRPVASTAGLFLVLVLGLVGSPGPASAAAPSLTLVAAATYDVEPTAAKVAVTARITATNHLHDTTTQRFYFTTAYLAVLPGTSGFTIVSPGLKPTVAVATKTSSYTLLKIGFGKQLAAGKSLALTLQFDIHDPGGAPDRAVRISTSIVSFTAWAFATTDTPGATVTVRFPTGYTVTIGRGPLSGPTTDASGRSVWTSGRLSNPLTFIADITADQPGDYTTSSLTATVGTRTAEVTLRSWPDDTAWRDRVGDLVVRALPALSSEIGLDWPMTVPLVVQEALVRSTGGYAGLFDPAAGTVQISYTASSGVVLHEAAHAWFNGRLVADRWAAEAFASYYAEQAAHSLGVKITSPALTDGIKASAFPLNAWGPTGSASAAAEEYGYAASLAFARAFAARAGDANLRLIWANAAGGVGGYQPAAGSEPVGSAPDWRGLLDIAEDTTGRSFDDLWRTWIARPQDLPLLDARAAARTAYAKAVADAGPWTLPRSIRDAMRAWQFDVATKQIQGAEVVLAERPQLQTAAAAAQLTLPPTLEATFEGTAGIPAAAAEASAEMSTIESIRQAAATDPGAAGLNAGTGPNAGAGAPTLLQAIGLLGADPAADLAAARTAFAAGQLDQAIGHASDAAASWTSAASTGRTRLVSLGLLALAALLLARMLWLRRRPVAASAGPDADATMGRPPDSNDPNGASDATLAR